MLKRIDSRRLPAAALVCCTALVLGLFVPATATAEEAKRYLVRYELGAKDAVLAELGPEALVHHEFDDLGVLAATLPTSAVESLLSLAAVLDVSEDPIHHLFGQAVPYGIDLVNARDEWDADRDDVIDAGAATGDGIRVCITDTGIMLDHEDLAAGGVEVLAGISFVGEDWAADRNGHGTHVAGTVAAMHNQIGVVGVSPGEVELLIADVFNDAGDGQASSTILAAAQWCADQGAHIISMSLGGKIGLLADGYQALYDRGILVIAAAGNDGAPVINFPAGYSSVVSVAAIDSAEAVASFSTFNPDVEVAAPGVAVLSTFPFENSLAVDGGPSYQANSMANTGPDGSTSGPLADGGDCNTAPAPGQFDGQVVLCERGGAPFRQKIDNAAAGGAVAAVIYNNVPGNFNGTYGDPCCSPIPSVSLSQADGQDAQSHLGSSATVNLNLVSTAGYAELSGTSMATPHASATAAVIWSACQDLDNDRVRSHLAATTRESQADLLAGRDILYGFGIVQVKEGVDALADGVDQYDPATGNGGGDSPANVECPGTVAGAAAATGGGWLAGHSGKVTFGFDAEQTTSGAAGDLSLHDHGQGVRVKISQLDSVAPLASDCGPVAAGGNAVEITGTGTLNSQPASFRACAADHGDPGRGADRFYLECTGGCAYDSASSAPDGVLGGGNVDVATSGGDATSSGGEASTLILDPILLDEGVAETLQVLTARVFGPDRQPLSGAAVTLVQATADGTVASAEALTGSTGEAVFSVTLPLGGADYQALAGSAESNPVIVATDD